MWRDLSDYRGAVLNSYRRDVWCNQPVRIEVWSEKGTIRGTLAPVLNDLRVTFRVFHGNCSTTVVHDIAAKSQQTDTPLVAFYVGDLDPSGAYMSDVDLPERLSRHGAHNVRFQRLALTVADNARPARLRGEDDRHAPSLVRRALRPALLGARRYVARRTP